MTKELFQDGYIQMFEAIVRKCEPLKDQFEVVLDQTAFYPEAGGQPSDTGDIDGIKVLDVYRKEGEIVHLLSSPFQIDQKVKGRIDWKRRYTFMQEHTAEHILSGLIYQQYGFDNVGFHMSDVVTMDTSGMLSWHQLMEIEKQANEVIEQGIEVLDYYPTKEQEQTITYRSKKEIDQDLRIVEIGTADRCACCGIHVKNTQEIGLVKILSVEKHKEGMRVELIAGQKAREDYQIKYNLNKEISTTLKSKPNETNVAVKRILDQVDEKEKELSKVYHAYYQEKMQHTPVQIYMEDFLSGFRLKQFCDLCMKEKETQTCAVVSQGQFVIQSKTLDLRQIKEIVFQELNGRGGGSEQILQGKFVSDPQTIQNVLEKVLRTS